MASPSRYRSARDSSMYGLRSTSESLTAGAVKFGTENLPDPATITQAAGVTRTEVVEYLQRISLREIAQFEEAKTLSFAVSEALRPGVIGEHFRPALGLEPNLDEVSAKRLSELRNAADPVLESIEQLAAELERTLLKLAALLDEEDGDRSSGSTLETS